MPRYNSTNYFVPHQSNTICDATGFKKKTNEVVKRWDGFYVIPEAYSPRQPQDFPATILPTQVFPHTRFEMVPAIIANPTDDATVLDSDLNEFLVTNSVLNSSSVAFTVLDNVMSSDFEQYVIFASSAGLEII